MTRLAEILASGRFAVTTELTPPKGIDLEALFASAERLKPYVDAINLTDSPRARMAIEPKSVGHLLRDRGIEPIIQMTARDRNRIALQADMLGAAALGLGNFVVMRGDQPENGDHPEAKAVFDLNAAEMLRAARALAAGADLAGNPLRGTPELCVGATANPGAADFDWEVQNTRRKIEAGAQFLQTQAVYEPHVLERFLEAVKPGATAVLAGIIPLKSARMARWLNDNVPGVHAPERLIGELDAVAGSAAEARTGIEITARVIAGVRGLCAGVHVMAIGWEERIPAILEASGVRSSRSVK